MFEKTVNEIVEETMFKKTLDQLELLKIWEWIEETNPSGQLPYHNNHHMFNMARIADMLLSYSTPPQSPPGHHSALITACLFHDYGHSGGTELDVVNIERAVEAFRNCPVLHRGRRSSAWLRQVEELIRVTEFPFIHKPDTLLKKCIRDADLLYVISDRGPTIALDGLRLEMEVSKGRPITNHEMIEQNLTFLKEATLYLPVSQYIRDTAFETLTARSWSLVTMRETLAHVETYSDIRGIS